MPFVKGQSGNPGGRPKGIAELARRQTKDGAECVMFLCSVMRGKFKRALVKDRIEAAKVLLERGFGKATQVVDNEGAVRLIVEHVDGNPSSNSETA